jgi:hypothetical protein
VSKLSNKSEFSLKRRPTTRRSGFKSHPDSISNLIKYAGSKKFIVQKNENLIVNFKLLGTVYIFVAIKKSIHKLKMRMMKKIM